MKKIIYLLFAVLLIGMVSGVSWSPSGNVDLKDYWNMTNLNYFDSFTMNGNVLFNDYNATGINFLNVTTIESSDYGLVEDDIPDLTSTWDNQMDADRLTGVDYLNNKITLDALNITTPTGLNNKITLDALNITTPTGLNNKITLNWANITSKFITAIDDIYIYMSGTTATLNETKLNQTIQTNSLNWTYLQNYPAVCPEGSYLTQLNDSVTCTTPSEYLLRSGGNMTGAINNLSQSFISNGENLISYWAFDEESGSIAYDSAGSNDGEISGATLNASGKFGNAYDFDGVNDYVNIGTVGQFDEDDNFTISGWTYRTSNINHQPLFSNYRIFVFDNYFSFKSSTSGDLITYYTAKLNTWEHFVGTYKKEGTTSTMSIYIDGSFVCSSTKENFVSDYSIFFTSKIGRTDHSFINYYTGSIDEVRIWNRTLTQTEITAEYLLSPHASGSPDGDKLRKTGGKIIQSSLIGNALWIYRNLASASTNSPLVFIEQDNAGDDQYSLLVQQDAGTITSRFENNQYGANTNYVFFGPSTTSNGRTAFFYRNLNSTYTSAPVVAINNVNADDDKAALLIQQDGNGPGIYVASKSAKSSHLHLVPQAEPSGSPTEGDIYADTDHHLYYYNSTDWVAIA